MAGVSADLVIQTTKWLQFEASDSWGKSAKLAYKKYEAWTQYWLLIMPSIGHEAKFLKM